MARLVAILESNEYVS